MEMLMMKKKREVLLKNWLSSSSTTTTWEERAFAEDAFGGGQMIWPPRSYSCSFCKREFRSAQALGGHMNVHRRDRAACRLINWSPPPHYNSSSRVSISSSSFSINCSNTNIMQQKCKSDSPFSYFHNPTRAASVGNMSLDSDLPLHDDLEAAMDMVSCCNKRAKTSTASLSMEEIDLELRLGDPRPYNKMKK